MVVRDLPTNELLIAAASRVFRSQAAQTSAQSFYPLSKGG